MGCVPSGNLISITKIEKKEDQSKWGKIVFLMAYLTGNGGSEWNPQKDYWVCLEGEDGEKFFKEYATQSEFQVFPYRSMVPQGEGVHNVRNAPSLHAPIVGEVPAGAVVDISELINIIPSDAENENTEWLQLATTSVVKYCRPDKASIFSLAYVCTTLPGNNKQLFLKLDELVL